MVKNIIYIYLLNHSLHHESAESAGEKIVEYTDCISAEG